MARSMSLTGMSNQTTVLAIAPAAVVEVHFRLPGGLVLLREDVVIQFSEERERRYLESTQRRRRIVEVQRADECPVTCPTLGSELAGRQHLSGSWRVGQNRFSFRSCELVFWGWGSWSGSSGRSLHVPVITSYSATRAVRGSWSGSCATRKKGRTRRTGLSGSGS